LPGSPKIYTLLDLSGRAVAAVWDKVDRSGSITRRRD
jgi:hypothetical protein